MKFVHIIIQSDNWSNYVKTMLELAYCDIVCLITHTLNVHFCHVSK